jgi:hypothetical protein
LTANVKDTKELKARLNVNGKNLREVKERSKEVQGWKRIWIPKKAGISAATESKTGKKPEEKSMEKRAIEQVPMHNGKRNEATTRKGAYHKAVEVNTNNIGYVRVTATKLSEVEEAALRAQLVF